MTYAFQSRINHSPINQLRASSIQNRASSYSFAPCAFKDTCHMSTSGPMKYRVEPSLEMSGLFSTSGLLTVGPRLTGGLQGSFLVFRVVTQMSLLPKPPGRSELKYSDSPSNDTLGPPSSAELFTVGPRLTGVPQGSSLVFRVVTQMSCEPKPGRSAVSILEEK